MYNNKKFSASLTKVKIALALALVLGGVSAAVARGGENGGGYVVPGNLDGVNPAYHPEIFGDPATARAYGFVQTPQGTWVTAPALNAHAQGKVRNAR